MVKKVQERNLGTVRRLNGTRANSPSTSPKPRNKGGSIADFVRDFFTKSAEEDRGPKRPFFNQFLESQDASPAATKRYPNDSDLPGADVGKPKPGGGGFGVATKKFPSDSDSFGFGKPFGGGRPISVATRKFPSDRD